MEETFMKERSVLPLIISMALPMIISMLVNALYNIVDSFFVAQISEEAMTALSLVYPIQNFVNAVAIGFGVGINAAIAFYLGAGNQARADRAASHGMVLAVLHGTVLTFASILVMPHFLSMFTQQDDIIQMGLEYSNTAFLFSVVVAISLAFEKIFQAVGRMKMTMVSLLCGCVTNIVLDPVLIFGAGPFPKMGIQGAAIATGIGQVVTLVIYLLLYQVRPISVKIRREALSADWELDKRLYAVGIPAILNLALPSLTTSALNGILAFYSQSYVFILGIYYKLQTFLYLPASGIVQGMRPVIGYNYGAGEYCRVEKIYRTALMMNVILMTAGTIICAIFSPWLIGLFTVNTETVESGALALRIISAGFIVSAVSVTACGALEGLGKGMSSLMISLLRYVIIIVPAAYLLSHMVGAVGVWHAFWMAEVMTAVLAAIIYYYAVQRSLHGYMKDMID